MYPLQNGLCLFDLLVLGRLLVFVNLKLMLNFVKIGSLGFGLVGKVLLLLVDTEEETDPSADNLGVDTQRGLLHNFNGTGIVPDTTLPELTGKLDSPETVGRGEVVLSLVNELEENCLDSLVELVVLGLVVGIAHLGDNTLVDLVTEDLGGSRSQNREEGLEELGGGDNVLVLEKNQALDKLLSKIMVEGVVLLQQELGQIVGEGLGQVGERSCNLGHKSNKFRKSLSVCSGRLLHKDSTL